MREVLYNSNFVEKFYMAEEYVLRHFALCDLDVLYSNINTRTAVQFVADIVYASCNVNTENCIQEAPQCCRRETARRFMSLNISLSHSRSLKVIKMAPK